MNFLFIKTNIYGYFLSINIFYKIIFIFSLWSHYNSKANDDDIFSIFESREPKLADSQSQCFYRYNLKSLAHYHFIQLFSIANIF